MPRGRGRTLTEAQFRELYATHNTTKAMAKASGLTPQAICLYCKRYMVPVKVIWHRKVSDDELRRAWTELASVKDCAEALDVSEYCIRRRLLAIGIDFNPKYHASPSNNINLKFTHEMAERLFLKFKMDMTQEELCRRTLFDDITVRRLIRRHARKLWRSAQAPALPEPIGLLGVKVFHFCNDMARVAAKLTPAEIVSQACSSPKHTNYALECRDIICHPKWKKDITAIEFRKALSNG